MTKFTNRHNLPEAIQRAIEQHQYELQGDISTTSLIDPPQIFQLKKRHADKIVTDVMDLTFSLFGTAIHGVLERASQNAAQRTIHKVIDEAVLKMETTGLADIMTDMVPKLQGLFRAVFNVPKKRVYMERTFKANISGWTLTGTPDYIEDCCLDDYKVCRAWAVRYETKEEWEWQGNVNAWLATQNGVQIDTLRIIALLRDWSSMEAMKSTQYPQEEIQVIPVPRLRDNAIRKYIEERIAFHQEAERLPDDQLPMCTKKERWAKPETWAVTKLQKNGKPAQRAYRLCNSPETAEDMAVDLMNKKEDQYEVIYRPGTSVRCEKHCAVSAFCHQNKTMKGAYHADP